MKHALRIGVAAAAAYLLVGGVTGTARGAEGDAGYPLSLEESLRLALEQNLDLVIARTDPQISEQQLEIDRAAFDPTLSFSTSTDETVQAPIDPTRPNERKNIDFSSSIAQELPFGADYSATFFTNRNDAPSFNVINPFHSSGLNLQFNLPLLQGLGKEATMEQVLLAKANLKISREDLRRQANETLEVVEGAYWDALAAGEALVVERKALKRAQDLLNLNRKKVDVGTLAPIEITQAEAGVASQEEGVILAETALANAEDELRRLLAVPADDPIWDRPLRLTDRPVFEPQDIDLDRTIEQALANRAEMLNAEEELRKKELTERAARNGAKHRLDLDLRFTPSGDNLGVVDMGGVPTPVKEDFGDSVSEISEVDNYFWRAGLTYTIPIGNKAARSALRIAELDRSRSEVTLRNQRQSIRVEVRAAVREVESGIKRVEAAQKNVELQEKKLNAEQKKFENGMSTSFEVLTFQNDLADAELSLIQAALNYMKSLSALERTKGTLLQARGLRLAD